MKNDTISRAQHDDKFFVLERALAQDKRISFMLRGLLVYILSKPNDWQIRIKDLRNQDTSIGRDRVYKLLNEGIQYGYIKREIVRGERGRVIATNYFVYETPLPEIQETAPQLPDLPDTAIQEVVKTQENCNTKPKSQLPDLPDTAIQDNYIIQKLHNTEAATEYRDDSHEENQQPESSPHDEPQAAADTTFNEELYSQLRDENVNSSLARKIATSCPNRNIDMFRRDIQRTSKVAGKSSPKGVVIRAWVDGDWGTPPPKTAASARPPTTREEYEAEQAERRAKRATPEEVARLRDEWQRQKAEGRAVA